jgi:IclR family transcriptional regulator, KDG regulon repressor
MTVPDFRTMASNAARRVDKTLTKGLHLMELMSCSGAMGISALAGQTGLTKSNVHRLVKTLCVVGWVQKVETDSTYKLSSKIWEIGQRWISHFDLPRIAGPCLASLASKTQETVHLGVLDGDDVVFLVTIDSPLAVRAYTPLGSRAPAYCVATGKALLAFLPAAQRRPLPEAFARYTSQSITSRKKLDEELERIRRRGYAMNRSEWQEGVNGIAAPVFAGRTNSVIGSVGLSGPAERLNQKAMRCLATVVQDAALAISEAVA